MKKNRVDTVFTLIIFCVFAVSVFLVLMLAGSVYSNIVETAATGQNERVALSYVRTVIRGADEAGRVFAADFDGVNALHLEEDDYLTRIYYYDGWVRELFHMKGLEFAPRDGVPLIRAESLGFEELENGLLYVYTHHGSLLINRRTSR